MTDQKKLIEAMFDDAIKLRNADDLAGAHSLLTQLIQQVDPNDKVVLGHSHMQLGLIAQLRGERGEQVVHFQAAVAVLPHSDLASNNLFGALFMAGRFREAYEEIVRLLRITYSPRYGAMFDEPGYGDDLTGELRALYLEARRLLAKRRPAYLKALELLAKRRPS
ncbi:MAG TPA: hypothetical protein VH165_14225 [Kofleriaceae bacterium]|jgi:tetratricopeptide (TPR) repeat protein|nr:hypothetical protein [Kofleriaceae bacterium]